MQPWDGMCGRYRYKKPEGLMVDREGTVWYTTRSGAVFIWCTAARLPYLLHRLWNTTQGGAVDNLAYMAAMGRNW